MTSHDCMFLLSYKSLRTLSRIPSFSYNFSPIFPHSYTVFHSYDFSPAVPILLVRLFTRLPSFICYLIFIWLLSMILSIFYTPIRLLSSLSLCLLHPPHLYDFSSAFPSFCMEIVPFQGLYYFTYCFPYFPLVMLMGAESWFNLCLLSRFLHCIIL
jgi:hypothetical protein